MRYAAAARAVPSLHHTQTGDVQDDGYLWAEDMASLERRDALDSSRVVLDARSGKVAGQVRCEAKQRTRMRPTSHHNTSNSTD